jgi:hypothetical protein
MVTFPSDGLESPEGALAAIREAAANHDLRKDFRMASEAFQEDDHRELIALAWRHQFDSDRSKFKREVKGLEQQVRDRILNKLELER